MRTDTVKKFRWFWPWEDEEEESWLEGMSRGCGLHLVRLTWPAFYTFTRSQARDFTYRLDYRRTRGAERPSYVQLFEDAGWEHILEFNNWHYFRKEGAPGERPEIFTDQESRIAKHRRLMALAAVFLPMSVMYSTNPALWEGHRHPIIIAARILLGAAALLWAYISLRLWIRIRELRRSAGVRRAG